jgi:NAD-dependent DNA ligase
MKITRKEAETLFARLSWEILEHKFRYYCGAKYSIEPTVIDEVYDKIEDKYRKLAKLLGHKTTATDMVGFDYNKPSCRAVMSHIIAREGKKRR